jgi:hypothetical protein
MASARERKRALGVLVSPPAAFGWPGRFWPWRWQVRTTVAGGAGVHRRLERLDNMAMALISVIWTGGSR